MTSAIIVAAGSGKRMGKAIPKQFIEINGKSILEHTVTNFMASNLFDEIIIVLAEEYINSIESITRNIEFQIKLCAGGKERFHSVQNALQNISTNCEHVFIHDAVRPFCSHELLQRCLNSSRKRGSAIPAVPVKDSIRWIKSDNTSEPVDRTNLRSIQTPQVFNYKKLLEAYKVEYDSSFTDDAVVFEKAGNKVQIVEGEPINIKITTPEDLAIAQTLLV